ncbi:MAG: TAXI family TRAP transporter solute-binding subunit, partial [Oxalobacteraceae bacterium]
FGMAGAAAREPVNVSLITAPFGTGSYVMGSALEEISKKKHAWLHINSSESPGFIFNVKKLDREPALKKSMIIGSGAGVAGLAESGQKPFDKKYPAEKLIANYSLGAYWLATLDPKIKSIKDLAGKKVALGRAAQINWAVQPEWIMRIGYGLGKDKVNVQYVGVQEAVDALLDGTADAAIVGGYFDPLSKKMILSPQTAQFLASNRKMTHLSWGHEAVDKAKAKGMKMVNITIPPNTIAGVTGPLEVAADTTSWMVSPDFPEDLAYETTKLIIDNIKVFGDYHALGKLMSPAGLLYGWESSEIHPGALRAYREAGIIK